MFLYVYKAKNINGELFEGKCLCNDEDELVVSLRDRGLYTIKYKEIKAKKRFILGSKVPSKVLSIFCSNFSSLLQSGINISEVLDILYSETSNKRLKESIREIKELLNQGAELSYCMKLHNKIYPKFLISMIKVGEESGKLDIILSYLSDFYHNENKIKNRIIKSLIYPVITFVAGIFIMEFMLNNIVPVFTSTLESLNASIPMVTRVFIAIGMFVNNSFIYLILASALLFVLIKHSKAFKNMKMLFHNFLLHNGFTKIVNGKLIAVRFSKCMGILLGSGIHIIKSFEIACDVIENEYAKAKINKCIDKIKSGGSISECLKHIDFFPDFLFSMVRIGEETGSLKEALLRASSIMEMELNDAIEKMTTLLQPILTIIISVMIGFMLIALFTPMIHIMDAI